MSNDLPQRFDVVLQSYQRNEEIRVISAIRHATGIRMSEAKELVGRVPVVVGKALPMQAAQVMKADLESGFWPGMRNFQRLPSGESCCAVEVRESTETLTG